MIAITTLGPFLAAVIGLAMAAPTEVTSPNYQRTKIYVQSRGAPLTQSSNEYGLYPHGIVELKGGVKGSGEAVKFREYHNKINPSTRYEKNYDGTNPPGNMLTWGLESGSTVEYVTRSPKVWSEGTQRYLRDRYGGHLPEYNNEGWGLDNEAREGDNWVFDVVLDCNKYPEFEFKAVRVSWTRSQGVHRDWEKSSTNHIAQCGETTYVEAWFN
ncbi:hypothetical protein BKA69DRAFT_1045206 [Paraphysoderma sedebokerense]|nr:hypothetical protein BKA69DRAFT_1045206 [Paraphysoderma sedebokerense]